MASQNDDFDVVIIGAGPAGLSAAIWCRDLGLQAVVFERSAEAGGQLLKIYNPITNYPGIRAANGGELRDRFLETARDAGVRIEFSTEVVEIDESSRSILTAAGRRYSAKAIILATGVRRRGLDIPGELEFAGKGVIESGSRDKDLAIGKRVVIVGGGDAALENALILSDRAAVVYVIHRREAFSARQAFVERAAKAPSIKFVFNSRLTRINGADKVGSVEMIDQLTGNVMAIEADIVLARIGVEPDSRLISDPKYLDNSRYALPGPNGQLANSMIFAIGDVANRIAPTIAGAVGAGASAAKAIRDLSRRKKDI